MSNAVGPWRFDRSEKYESRRVKGGPLFTSDIGDVEKVARMRKAREVAAIPDSPLLIAQKARRRRAPAAVAHPVAPASEFTPEEALEWTDATARFDAVAKKEGADFTPLNSAPVGPAATMVDLLARTKAARAVAKAAHADDPEPDESSSISEQLAAARAKAGK